VPTAAPCSRRGRRAHRSIRSIRAVAALIAVGCLLPACTGGDDDPIPTTTVAMTTTTTIADVSDGTLRIGIFLPLTGPGASLGPPLVDGIEAAIADVNANGGVFGRDVEIELADEGSATVDELLAQDVDAIIGPASSLVALSGLAPAFAPQSAVVVCSPMATSSALDDYQDNKYFFRTAPSDTLQMEAIAMIAERTGAQTAAIGYIDDPYGRGLYEALDEALADGPVTVVQEQGFNSDQEDLSDVAETLLADDPRVVVVLGDAPDGSRLLAALDAATDDPPIVIINDSIRQARQVIQNRSDAFREQITGVAPQSSPATVDDEVEDLGFFVAHAIDCAYLIALAAIEADSDSATDLRRDLPAVSTGGRFCVTFAACIETLGRDLGIDFNGRSGRVDLSSVTGDPIRAWFETFRFDEEGNEEPGEPLEVGG
jgi:branched-chain amino acid transport system substrate-binding protein